MLQAFCFQELQDCTGINSACSAWKLLHIKGGLSPFLLMKLHFILHYYGRIANTCLVILEISRSNQMMVPVLNLLMFSDQEERY